LQKRREENGKMQNDNSLVQEGKAAAARLAKAIFQKSQQQQGNSI
jgi:hypothetical protein